jgi:hypothetical protein
MNRAHRQALSLIALVIAGASSLATTQGPPTVFYETKDRLSFSGDQRTEVRHVRVVVAAGKGKAHVTADVPVEVGGVDGKRPVTLTVVRDSDGTSVVLDDFGPGYQAGTVSSLAGDFTAIESCPSGQTCSESFTFTFERIAEDTRPDLAFDWSVRATAEWPGSPPPGSPPPGASLDVTIAP